MSGFAIAPEGQLLLAVLAALAVLLFVLAAWSGRWSLWLLGYVVTTLALAGAFFFRDPERGGPRGPGVFVAPADGQVVEVSRVEEPHYLDGPALRVSIFLSLLDVHVQRAPASGIVERVEHQPGRFGAAWSEEAGRRNESTRIGIDTGDARIVVRQVAGLVARRIVTYVAEGQRVEQGERIGLIRFGSRVEAYLPAEVEPSVRPGDRVVAGRTVIARRALAKEET